MNKQPRLRNQLWHKLEFFAVLLIKFCFVGFVVSAVLGAVEACNVFMGLAGLLSLVVLLIGIESKGDK